MKFFLGVATFILFYANYCFGNDVVEVNKCLDKEGYPVAEHTDPRCDVMFAEERKKHLENLEFRIMKLEDQLFRVIYVLSLIDNDLALPRFIKERGTNSLDEFLKRELDRHPIMK